MLHICKINFRLTDGIITIIAPPAQFGSPYSPKAGGVTRQREGRRVK